jgi:Protein of unknown function (DUF2490)
MVLRIPLLLYLVLSTVTLFGQSNEQIWVDYTLTHSLANTWKMDHPFRYSSLLGDPHWGALTYLPSVSWSINQYLDLVGGVTVSRVWQTSKINTFEFRPMLGCRIHVTPNSRILTGVLLRFEQRNIKNLSTMRWSSSYRMRLKVDAMMPLNNRTMAKDKLWYGMVDVEWFVSDVDLRERFSNLFRLNSGLGYRINYNFRVECYYAYQQSRNQLGEETFDHDNIFRVRLRHFINNRKPA